MTGPARLRVFVVDDHALVRSGIRTELGDAVGARSEGWYTTGKGCNTGGLIRWETCSKTFSKPLRRT